MYLLVPPPSLPVNPSMQETDTPCSMSRQAHTHGYSHTGLPVPRFLQPQRRATTQTSREKRHAGGEEGKKKREREKECTYIGRIRWENRENQEAKGKGSMEGPKENVTHHN